VALPVWAEPRTLYKPDDVANAKENVARYAWAQAIMENWRARSNSSWSETGTRRSHDSRADTLANLRPELSRVCGQEIVDGRDGNLFVAGRRPERLTCNYSAPSIQPAVPGDGKLVCPAGARRSPLPDRRGTAHPEDTSGGMRSMGQLAGAHQLSGVVRAHKADYVVSKALRWPSCTR